VASGSKNSPEVGDIIASALKVGADLPSLRARVNKLTEAFPLYEGLENW
jgi:glycine hydroxymethyltransferase